MHLYMIRHGQSYINLASWSNGNTDEGLTDLGRRQAEAAANWLREEVPAVDSIYSSTMRRARETVAFLEAAYEQEGRCDSRLREVGNNRLDHSPWPNDNLPPEYADYSSSERPFAPVTPSVDNAETLMHFRTRIGLFIEEIARKHADETIVAVCHGHVIEAAFDHVFNVGAFRHCDVRTENTGITHFEYVNRPRRETWRLHGHNQIEHLRGIEETVGAEMEKAPA